MRRRKLKLINLGKFFSNKGVSFTEVLVALFIISVSIVTFLTLASTQLRILKLSKDKFLAHALSLEGLELVEAYRNSQINQTNWLGLLSNKGDYCLHFDNGNFYIRRINDCSDGGRLYLVGNRYLHVGRENEKTLFKRIIHLEDALDSENPNLSESEFVKVISIVKLPNEEIKLETILTKWHPLFQ
jgi:hypothetical protein